MPKTKTAKSAKTKTTIKTNAPVDNAESLEQLIQRAINAQKIYAEFSQEKVDKYLKQQPQPLTKHVFRWHVWLLKKQEWEFLKIKS